MERSRIVRDRPPSRAPVASPSRLRHAGHTVAGSRVVKLETHATSISSSHPNLRCLWGDLGVIVDVGTQGGPRRQGGPRGGGHAASAGRMSDDECSPGSKCAPTISDAGFKAFCFEACETAATCGQGTGPYIPENHICENGACIYLGCSTNNQCKELQSNWTCHAGTPPTCLQECASSAECGSNLPAWDADNYQCEGGACIYQGCNSDRECDALSVFTSMGPHLLTTIPPAPALRNSSDHARVRERDPVFGGRLREGF